MQIGYARVSTADQNLDLQRDALQAAGCERIYGETVSGNRVERPELVRALDALRPGDTLMVWKLDRLGRSLKELVALVEAIADKGAGLVSLSDPIDTTSAQGRLVFSIFAALAEFERNLIVERTRAGLAAARARGRRGGRPPGLSPAARTTAAAAEALYREGHLSVVEITRTLGIGKATLYRYLRYRGVQICT